MSLFGSLFTGVSALSAQSQSMGMISNNIANVNTVGYKRNVASFSDLVTQETRSTAYAPGGVRASTQTTINQQGILQQTSSSTDAAVSGEGFFVVKRGTTGTQETLYTRAGSFSEDARGFLRNTNGFYLYGWRLDDNGNLPPGNADVSTLEPVDVAFLNGITAPTSAAEVTLNLNANQTTGGTTPHFSRAITVYDSLGGPQQLYLEFTKTASNTWDMNVLDAPGGTSLIGGATSIDFDPTTGGVDTTGPFAAPLAYDATTGQLTVTTGGINWGNGSDPAQTIAVDISNVSQFAADYSVAFVDQNGAELGLRTGVSIDREGYVVASFSNGLTRNLYKLPVATFTNPNGLEGRSGNVYIQTQDSGDYNLREAGTSGAGLISPSSLESSNVDLADEFSRMIITQRAYSAGTKVITTSDQMLQELLQLR
ncbi:flagellar hook protein FlgE [Arenibaculum sp.]|jgi:flagellar hook protein FlgE|uniref:flagellar hook protein FlgE n=1 Tax=Arenibaculum sp. TaxID=2865862 RepID=UPI002E13EF62|nr:flagellar hook protein FlgE [Arenibaculum sp.]